MADSIGKQVWGGIVLAILVVAALLTGCAGAPEEETVDIVGALSSDRDTACYEQAREPGIIRFPEDHGPHEKFMTEWWYYTGNLKTREGRHFGYQLTFFRQALACDTPEGDSQWRTGQLYFAHFAVTDTLNQRFYPAQRMNRGSVGIAGAKAGPFRVWIDDWSAADAPASGQRTILLKAAENVAAVPGKTSGATIAIDLALTPEKPPILQGDRGLSKKGPGPSDASHYYSLPGMPTRGTLTVDGEFHKVSGHTWFDHEWSTSALGEEVVGWDWFALRLDTGPRAGTDLMVCHVRRADGSPNGYGFGSISHPDGQYEILDESGFSIRVDRHWTSPASGSRYPAGWEIRLPEYAIDISISPVMDGQEHTHMFSYYEGAIMVRSSDGNTIGTGYVEMTGY